jgi:hypothetical protein
MKKYFPHIVDSHGIERATQSMVFMCCGSLINGNPHFSIKYGIENGDVPMPFISSFQRGMGESPFPRLFQHPIKENTLTIFPIDWKGSSAVATMRKKEDASSFTPIPRRADGFGLIGPALVVEGDSHEPSQEDDRFKEESPIQAKKTGREKENRFPDYSKSPFQTQDSGL